MRTLFAIGSFTLMALAGLMFWFHVRADAFVLRLHGARRLHFEEAPQLHALLALLSIAAGVPCPRLYRVQGARPNAFALGARRSRARIVLTGAALEELDGPQLRAMLAHELAHIAHGHTRRATLVEVLAALFARWRPSPASGAVVERLHRLGMPPERDFLADRLAAQWLGDPSGLAAVLERLKAHGGREAPATEVPVGTHFMGRARGAHVDARITALRGLAAERQAGGLRPRALRRPSRFFPRSDSRARRSLAWEATWDAGHGRPPGPSPARRRTRVREEEPVDSRLPSARLYRPSRAGRLPGPAP